MNEDEIIKQVEIYINLLLQERKYEKASIEQIRFQEVLEGLLDLYKKEKEKNKELEKENAELRRLKNKLSIATAIALDGRKISISKKSLNELNDMFSIEVEYRPFYDDYVFYAK